MQKLVLTLAVALTMGLGVRIALAADDSDSGKKEQKITGTLIDEKCAAKFTDKDNPQEAAEKHSASCALGCHKNGDGSPFVLLHGKDKLKLDEKGQKLAQEFLEKKKETKVTVTGTKDGDEIKVASIDAAEKSDSDKSEK